MDTTTPSWIRRLASGARARWCLTATLLAAASLLLACGGGDTADEASPAGAPSVVTAIAVTPADSKIGVGLTQQLAAQARDQYGAVMSGVTITWTSSNPAVATVADGVVRGVSAGQTSITASSGGVTSAPAVLTATPVAGGRIVVDKASVFFTASGQTARLSASVFDAQGQLVPGDVRWSSSAPGQVSIDANGQVTALGVGSASLVAEASGVRSPPTLAIVAVPQPGTLLVADAQVVAISPLRAAPAGGADRYDATLRDFAVPPVGALLLAAETAPLAGRVVAARADAAGVIVTLEQVPLHRLLADYDIRLAVDLSAFPVEAKPAAAAARQAPLWGSTDHKGRLLAAARPLADAFAPFKAWDCEAKLEPTLAEKKIALTLENKLNLILEDRAGYSKHALEGSAEIVGSAGLVLKAGLKASGRCDAQGQIKLPVFGWFSALVMPAVRIGLGAELEGEIRVVQGELSIAGRVGIAPVMGWECGGATPSCRGLDAAPVTNNLKTTSRIPSDNDVQAKVSAHFYVVAGLDATFFLGAVNAQIVEARIGPKQSFDLAFEPSQAALDGYASQYDLKLEGVIEPGAALKKAIEKVIGSDSTTVSFSAGFTRDISESPKGTLSVSAARVRPDAPLDFTVELAPTSSMEYWLLGYNVTGWQLYRKRSDELDFTPWKAMTQTASNRATYRWVPTEADAGTYEFAAFVNTQLVTPLLEVAPDSRRTVEVSCFSGGSAAGPTGTRGRSAALAAAPGQICADAWAGDVTYIAKTPGLPTANIATKATITWVVDPARSNNLSTSYKATGRFELAFNHPDACVSKLVPNSFAIVDSPITPSTLTLFHTPLAPPSYGFGGAQLVDLTVTVSCPGRNDVVTELRGFLVNFAYGTGPLAANQATLAGSIEDAATTATWNFNRP